MDALLSNENRVVQRLLTHISTDKKLFFTLILFLLVNRSFCFSDEIFSSIVLHMYCVEHYGY